MVASSFHFLVLVFVSLVRADYVWDGTDWKWQDTVDKHTIDSEGSGDQGLSVDDTEYDDEDNYDYGNGDEDTYDYSDRQIAKTPSFNQPIQTHSNTNSRNKDRFSTFDDEELGESSGDDDIEEEDLKEGSGGFHTPDWRDEVTDPPPRIKPGKVDFPAKHDLGKIHSKFEKEDNDDTMYVDHDNYNKGYTPPLNEDVFFDRDNDRDVNRNSIEVTTTTTTKKHHIPKPTESSGVHREGHPNHRPVSFFAQPGILAAVIGGAVVGLLCAILLVMFIVYRMRKKDEGSYALDEPKRAHNANSYSKPPSREFYA